MNYQELDRTSTAAWASIPRFGARAARQFTGLGEGDGMTISGVIFPKEFGGRAQYEAIRFTDALGQICELYSTNECRHYFKAAGYEAD